MCWNVTATNRCKRLRTMKLNLKEQFHLFPWTFLATKGPKQRIKELIQSDTLCHQFNFRTDTLGNTPNKAPKNKLRKLLISILFWKTSNNYESEKQSQYSPWNLQNPVNVKPWTPKPTTTTERGRESQKEGEWVRWAWKGEAKEWTWGPRPCPWFALSSSPSWASNSRTTPWISSPSSSSCPHGRRGSVPPPLMMMSMLTQVAVSSSLASLLRRTTASWPLSLAL